MSMRTQVKPWRRGLVASSPLGRKTGREIESGRGAGREILLYKQEQCSVVERSLKIVKNA
jgi:hypothetical protein